MEDEKKKKKNTIHEVNSVFLYQNFQRQFMILDYVPCLFATLYTLWNTIRYLQICVHPGLKFGVLEEPIYVNYLQSKCMVMLMRVDGSRMIASDNFYNGKSATCHLY